MLNKVSVNKKLNTSQQRSNNHIDKSNPLPRKRKNRGRNKPISIPSSNSLSKVEEEDEFRKN